MYIVEEHIDADLSCSVVVPDTELSAESGSGYGSWKNHWGSEQLWIQNKSEVNLLWKLINFDSFWAKMLNLKK